MFKVFSIFFTALSLTLAAEEAKTFKVEASEFVYKSELPGIILSSNVKAVKIDAKQFQNWKLIEAAVHGAAVKKGDVIARFDAEAFEEEVKAKKRSLDIQKANLQKTQKLFELNMQKMDFDRKRSQLSAEAAKKKALIYKEKGHELAINELKQGLVDAKNSLLYQQEELNQLKKMYDEDKITEETEEIVLKRQKNYVESLSKRLQVRELAVEEALNVKIPGDLFNSEYNKANAIREEEKNKMEWDVFVLTEKLKLEAAELAYAKAEKNFKELLGDKAFLEIKAEHDGVIYYGKVSAGKWANQAGTEYKKGKVFLKGSSLFSLVDTSAYEFVGNADYTQVQYINDKSVVYSEVPGAGLKSLALKNKASVPNNGSFKVVFKIDSPAGIFHGTSGKAKLVSKLGNKVISVPATSVKRDELNPVKQYVEVNVNGKKDKLIVETGLVHNGKVVIKSGLQEGMEVYSK